MLGEEASAQQAAESGRCWIFVPGCRVLDAPCGWGRLSRPLAARGAIVLGVDQSETMIDAAEKRRGNCRPAGSSIYGTIAFSAGANRL